MEGPSQIEYSVKHIELSCAKCRYRASGFLEGTSTPNSNQYLACRHPKNPNGPDHGTLIHTWGTTDDCLYVDDRTPKWCPFLVR